MTTEITKEQIQELIESGRLTLKLTMKDSYGDLDATALVKFDNEIVMRDERHRWIGR